MIKYNTELKNFLNKLKKKNKSLVVKLTTPILQGGRGLSSF